VTFLAFFFLFCFASNSNELIRFWSIKFLMLLVFPGQLSLPVLSCCSFLSNMLNALN
jgi:hypothetical protein